MMKYRRKFRVCRLYMMDMWGSLMRKGRRSIKRGESESCEMVRFLRWSKQSFDTQRRIKEFYLRMKEVMRKEGLPGGRLRAKYKIKRYYGGINQSEYKRLLRKANKIKRIRDNRLRLIDVFIGFFERRMDVVLFRMNWVTSIKEGQKIIKEGYVTLNGKRVKNFRVMMRVGDSISVVNWGKERFRRRILRRMEEGDILVNYPIYVEVSYRSMTGVLWSDPVVREIPYTGRMDTEDVEGAIV